MLMSWWFYVDGGRGQQHAHAWLISVCVDFSTGIAAEGYKCLHGEKGKYDLKFHCLAKINEDDIEIFRNGGYLNNQAQEQPE